jgi:hypothetical protein
MDEVLALALERPLPGLKAEAEAMAAAGLPPVEIAEATQTAQ